MLGTDDRKRQLFNISSRSFCRRRGRLRRLQANDRQSRYLQSLQIDLANKVIIRIGHEELA